MKPQPALEDDDMFGFFESSGAGGTSELAVSISYTLWRNPADPDDPINLAELNEQMRVAIEEEPPWPRPTWLIERVQRMRYPNLYEVVQTSWNRETSPYVSLSYQLVARANHVLMNQFREALGVPSGPSIDGAWKVSETAVKPGASLEVDGRMLPAIEIETDPLVYAIGAEVGDRLVVTVVVPRDELQFIELALSTRVLE